jgi:uncharacterized RDD family membrane protein YckC
MLETEIRVQTPEQVSLQFTAAGIGSRALAQLIDLGLLFVLFILLGISIRVWSWLDLFGSATYWVIGFAIVLVFFIFWGYFIASEYFLSGRTLGKWICRIRVLQADGRSVSFYAALVRNLLRLIDFLPLGYLVGLISMMVDRHERRLGDLVAGTIVVLDRPLWQLSRADALESVDGAPQALPEIRVALPGVPGYALVVQGIPTEFRMVVEDFLKRRKAMAEDVREAIAQRLWADLVALPGVTLDAQNPSQEGVPGVTARTAEQVLRAVIKALRRRKRGDRR